MESAMSKDHFVIIGNGPAGHEAAITLRERVPAARITLINRGRTASYRRRLLPEFIAGSVKETDLYITPVAAYKDQDIKLRCGQRVVNLNIEARELTLDHKEILPFTGLIIAVGGEPRIPEPFRVYKELMHTLKTLEDARVWIDRVSDIESVLIIGGDLTSFAMTKALLSLNKKVLFVIDEDAFWPLRSDAALVDQVSQQLTAKGVQVLKRKQIKGLKRISDETLQIQADDQRIEVGMVGAFFGLVPDLGFLAGSGLSIDRGILVDEYLNAGIEGIYATGDCAQIYHPELRDYWISIGHDNATALGRTAALNLAGGQIQAEAPKESIFDVQGIRINTSWWMEY